MRRLLRSLRPPDQIDRRWWARTLAINGAGLLLVAVAIQLVPLSRSNPPVVREPAWDSAETRALAVQACFDCHSNETHWPWYARVAPVGWMLAYDVAEGREALNFSDWDQHDDLADPDDPFPPPPLEDLIEQEIRSGAMPPGTYRLANPEARLSEAEKVALIEGLRQTVLQNRTPQPD